MTAKANEKRQAANRQLQDEESEAASGKHESNGVPIPSANGDATLNGHPIGSPEAAQVVADAIAAAIPAIAAPQLPDQSEAMAKIQAAEEAASIAESEMNDAAEEHKARKKAFEVTIDSLRAAVRWANTPIVPDAPDLFTGTDKPGEQDDLWRSFPLERWTAYDLPKGIIKKLAEASPPIETVGQLADYQAPTASGWTASLTDIPGIGKGAAEKIGAASELFWQWWKVEGESIYHAEQNAEEPEAEEVA